MKENNKLRLNQMEYREIKRDQIWELGDDGEQRVETKTSGLEDRKRD